MQVRLVVVGGKASKREVAITLPAVIGRSREATLAVGHPKVSRKHCELREVEGALVARDGGSLNGTYLDGERIEESVVKPGSRLTIGPLTFEALYEHSGEFPVLLGEKPPPDEASPEVEAAEAQGADDEIADALVKEESEEAPKVAGRAEAPEEDAAGEEAPEEDAAEEEAEEEKSPAAEADHSAWLDELTDDLSSEDASDSSPGDSSPGDSGSSDETDFDLDEPDSTDLSADTAEEPLPETVQFRAEDEDSDAGHDTVDEPLDAADSAADSSDDSLGDEENEDDPALEDFLKDLG